MLDQVRVRDIDDVGKRHKVVVEAEEGMGGFATLQEVVGELTEWKVTSRSEQGMKHVNLDVR